MTVLDVDPTPAMLDGSQRVYQCSWCGCVVVSPAPWRPSGPCPAAHDEPTKWWEQTFPVAGLSLRPLTEQEQPMMTTPAPTPEEFLASIEPDDEGPQAPDPWTSPLESIAWSLQAMAQGSLPEPPAEGIVTKEEYDALARAYDDLEAKHQAVSELVDQVLAVCKPSVSKLANQVRETVEAWRNPVGVLCPVHGWEHKFKTCEEVTARESAAPAEAPEPPAHDADVWDWRAYAINLGHDNVEMGKLNRSQIRTLLGIEQPAGGESA